jgi:BASS family bile acid:Na+ symporter
MNAVLIVLPILTLLMFDLGLGCDIRSFAKVLRHPRPVLIGLTGQIVVMPIVAVVIGIVFHLDPLFFIGLILIACSPGGSSSNVFSMLAKGNVALSITLTALSSIITLFTIPIIMNWTIGFADRTMNVSVHLPMGKLIVQNLLLMFLPFLIGVIYARFFSKSAHKISIVLGKIAFPALMLLAAIFFIQNREVIIAHFGHLGVCIVSYILIVMMMAALLCYTSRLKGTDRRTIIIEVVMQNAAQAIAVASSPFIFNNNIIGIPAILYALFMNVVLLIYVAIVKNKVPDK